MMKLGLRRPTTLLMALMTLAIVEPIVPAHAEPRATEFTLSNGMQVVVIPDHRAPVVTQMLWFKAGAVDD
ncbi:MAG: insulinase family protein, partial [Bradyrhizobium sp.]